MQREVNPFTVLIAEDDHDLGLLVQRKLSRAGFETQRALSGRETLDICSKLHNSNVFLMIDYQLGDMTAREVVQELHARRREVPFIVTTGFGSEQVAVEMMKLGAQDYLVKNTQYLDLIVPVVSQVIEKKHTELALAQTKNALDAAHKAIMAAKNGIVIADTSSEDFPIVYYNPAFETITGYQCQESPTLSHWMASYYESQQTGLHEFRDALKRRHSLHIQLKGNESDTPTWHEVDLSFIPETENRKGTFIAIVTDITQKHISEYEITQLRSQLDQAQRLAITGQIARELAHEIGHPITLISSKIQFMLAKKTFNDQDLSAILQHIDRITNLLRRFSSGGSDEILNPRPVSVRSVVESVLNLFPESEAISLSVNIQEDLPEIHADKAKLIQVLLNLLSNALEASPQDQTEILFSAEERTYPGKECSFIAISVRDHGRGIAPENMSKIFEPFFSTKNGSQNRGLGLPICQTIANLHHGWIDIDSQLGQGTCVTVVLPVEPVAAGHVVSP